jgi:hypothetical protein
MNDLDRDLRELFHDKAGSVETAPSAPADVLLRGRRRQIATVITGFVATAAAVLVTVVVIGRITAPSTSVPATPLGYAERTTTIEGVTVTAPSGWALVDDWPIAAVLPTGSETCSFSATGVAVTPSPGGPSGAADGPGPVSPAAEATSSPSCATSQEQLPAGLPIVQLANFEPALDQTACGLGAEASSKLELSGDRAILYVARDVDAIRLGNLEGPMPASLDRSAAPSDGVCGRGWYARGIVGSVPYFAFIGLGPSASDADRNAVFDAYAGMRLGDDVSMSFPERGPGYVIAAGVDAGQPWRIEAGFENLTGPRPKIVAMLLTADEPGNPSSPSTFSPSAGAMPIPNWGAVDLGDMSRSIELGTASSSVTAIDIEFSDGSSTTATLLSWPQSLRSYAVDPRALDGSIWYGVVSQPGTPHPVLAPTSGESSPLPLQASALEYRVDGAATVANGIDLGHAWEFRAQGNTLDLRVDGSDAGGFTAAGSGESACGRVDVSGGTFLLCEETGDVSYVRVTADVSGEQPVADGRWMPAGDSSDGRAWIVPLPGEGTGYQTTSGGHPLALSWPSHAVPQPGDVSSAGMSDAISWAIRWTDQACPVMEVVYSRDGDTGTSSCLTPWDGSDPAVGGVYGQHEAAIILTGPERMTCDVHDPSGSVSDVFSGGTIAPVGRWSRTGQCLFTIPVGHTVTVRLRDPQGNPILGQRDHMTIRADPGSLTVGSPATAP